MNILFVCKYNRFRSRVAEIYLNSILKNKKIKIFSRGIIKGSLPLDEQEAKVAKKLGIILKGKPKTLSSSLLKKVDKIIVVANDIPLELFDNPLYKDKVELWKISDNKNGEDKSIEKIIKEILVKVKKLNKELETN